MKRILFVLFTIFSLGLYGQNDPNFIDFENGNFGSCGTHSPVEANVVDNAYFDCAYGVTFHMGSPGSGILPFIAEVGAPTVAFVGAQGNTYTSATGCTAAPAVTADKPSSTRDVGCFFLTDDPNGPGTNPLSLFVNYKTDCNVASGYLLDVDGVTNNSVQEGWEVNGYVAGNPTPVQTIFILSPQFALFDPSKTPFNTVGGDGEPSYWEIDLGSQTIDYIEFRYIGHPNRGVGIAFDDFFVCSAAENAGCCDGDNLIPNGSFEAGNTGFYSTYNYQGTIAANSIIPGEYGVVTPAEANAVSSQWNLVNHTTCDGSGRFMAINGRTMGSGSNIIYSQPGIQVDESKEYIFCLYYQHLPQCAFDVFKPSNLNIEFDGAIATQNDCNEDDDDLCGWTKVSFTLVPTGGLIAINILLDETGIGDGNDFALDDISMVEKQVMPAGYSSFNVQTNYVSGSIYGVTATAVTSSLPAGFDVTWKVEEVNCSNTNIVIPGTNQSWSINPFVTDFPGYCCSSSSSSPGKFLTGHCYRITRTVSNCCYLDQTSTAMVSVTPRLIPTSNGEAEGYEIKVIQEGQETISVLPVGDAAQSSQKSGNSDLQLFPNPGNGNLTIHGTSSLKGMKISVSDIKGKVLFTNQVKEEGRDLELDITDLPSGMYLIQLQSEDGAVRQEKYVKQ
jgi:hypothetical protein